jgi:hypothetical protein
LHGVNGDLVKEVRGWVHFVPLTGFVNVLCNVELPSLLGSQVAYKFLALPAKYPFMQQKCNI